MTEIRYTVVFKGETAKGHTADEVKRNLASTGMLSGDQLIGAFSGQGLTIKDLPRDEAMALVQAFETSGGLCQIEVQRHNPNSQVPHPQHPPQRPAYRPGPAAGAEFLETRPEPTRQIKPQASANESITCAKCGFMQPRGVECVKCGVLFDKIETVTELANDPDKIAREILERYRPRFRHPGVFLTPAIPSSEAVKVLRPYLAPNARWEDDEQFVINAEEELIAAFAVGETSNFLLTNYKIMTFQSIEGPICAGFDLWTIQNMKLIGPDKNILLVDEKTFQLPVVSNEDQESREIFIKMASEVGRALKQSARAARLKAKRAWETDPHRGRQEPPESHPPHIGGRAHHGRITLSSLDLRELQESVSTEETETPTESGEGKLLSSVKGLFKKK